MTREIMKIKEDEADLYCYWCEYKTRIKKWTQVVKCWGCWEEILNLWWQYQK